ncbi:uncharacterized protein BJ171DRAFT_596350 [Polychytrium aggregatum]|uniref:uncharacterized protein n=1 Tax=Polychytrium aggregatum TaxID=110093 RepID=UPI0022FE717E|nr:uncharacterized protein BJ171DRAFT_596350 [Polychytrium aggregatum]KAI9207928.1 hypothetical protein BJ171DRAFT_596350 [Polychytrium aggregatum]
MHPTSTPTSQPAPRGTKRPIDLLAIRQRQLAKKAHQDAPQSSSLQSPSSASQPTLTRPDPGSSPKSSPRPSSSRSTPPVVALDGSRAPNPAGPSARMPSIARPSSNLASAASTSPRIKSATRNPFSKSKQGHSAVPHNPFMMLEKIRSASESESKSIESIFDMDSVQSQDVPSNRGHLVAAAIRGYKQSQTVKDFESRAAESGGSTEEIVAQICSPGGILSINSSSARHDTDSSDSDEEVIEWTSDFYRDAVVQTPASEGATYDIMFAGDLDGQTLPDELAKSSVARTVASEQGVGATERATNDEFSGSDTRLPIDWNLKFSAVFHSPYSFSSINVHNSLHESEALGSFVERGNTVEIDTDHKYAFQHSLYHWLYPSQRLAPALSQAVLQHLKREPESRSAVHLDENMKHFAALQEEWKSAFRSLYFAMKNDVSSYFYYLNPEFSVLFLSPKVVAGESPKPKAVLSTSTPGLRRILESQGKSGLATKLCVAATSLGPRVPFEAVLPDPATRDLSQEAGKRVPLYFASPKAVHGLFDFLLNWRDPQLERQARQFPMLVSPHPFLHASLKSAQVSKYGKVQQASGLKGQNAAVGLTEYYRLEIRGLLLPTSVLALVESLKKHQKPGMTTGTHSGNHGGTHSSDPHLMRPLEGTFSNYDNMQGMNLGGGTNSDGVPAE